MKYIMALVMCLVIGFTSTCFAQYASPYGNPYTDSTVVRNPFTNPYTDTYSSPTKRYDTNTYEVQGHSMNGDRVNGRITESRDRYNVEINNPRTGMSEPSYGSSVSRSGNGFQVLDIPNSQVYYFDKK
jgi:hypothetical protein